MNRLNSQKSFIEFLLCYNMLDNISNNTRIIFNMINSVVIVGRVGQDPEMRYFETGKVKTAISLAVNRGSRGNEKTDWFRVELWDKQAELTGEYVKKGKLVAVEGRLDLNQWTDADGNKREAFLIKGASIRFLGGKNDAYQPE